MTTIAATRDEMAADSKVGDGDASYPGQKIYVFGQSIVGISGEGRAMGIFLRWMQEGEPPVIPEIGDPEHAGNFRALVLRESGIYVYDEGFWPDPVMRNYHAIGSGCHVALDHLRRGESAMDAVEAACDIDNSTGRPVCVVRLADVLKKKRARK